MNENNILPFFGIFYAGGHKMNIRKTAAVILCAALCFGISACGTSPENAKTSEPTAKSEETPADKELKPYTATEEEMKEAESKVTANELLRGIWVTPRLKMSQPQEDYDAEYKKVKDSGVNMICTYGETASKKQMEKLLEACEKNGLKIMISLNRIASETDIKNNLRIVEKYDSHPCVIGYNMFDEPNTDMFPLLETQYQKIREICSPDKLIMVNFLPNYASNAQLGVSGGENPYRDYLEKYFTAAHSDVVSFDYYPYRQNSSGDGKMYAGAIKNMCEIARTAAANNLPAWGFVQSGEWSGTRTPKLGELRFLTHFHLLFGLKGYSYFLYVTPIDGETNEGFFLGMVEYDGTIRETYNLVQKTCAEIDGMKGVYLGYNFKGLMYKNIPQSWEDGILDEYRLSQFADVKEITASDEGMLCGCFEKNTGEKGLYLLSCDSYYNQRSTVRFNKLTEYKVYGANGIEQMGAAYEIELEFISGEGKFIEIVR